MKRTECSDILAELERWYCSERGRYLLQTSRAAVERTLDTNFGYHLLQLGLLSDQPLMERSRISHKLFCAERGGEGIDLVAYADELPLESDSVDTVIVHHCLEFARNPHRVLREIQRVLTPQGQLLIAAFNPVSALGVEARARGMLRDTLWQNYRPITPGRLTDWLHLLNCEVHQTFHTGSFTPFGRGRFRQWMTAADAWLAGHNVPLGGVFIVHASKQVVGMHPTRQKSPRASGRLIGLVSNPRPAAVPVPSAPAPRNQKRVEEGTIKH